MKLLILFICITVVCSADAPNLLVECDPPCGPYQKCEVQCFPLPCCVVPSCVMWNMEVEDGPCVKPGEACYKDAVEEKVAGFEYISKETTVKGVACKDWKDAPDEYKADIKEISLVTWATGYYGNNCAYFKRDHPKYPKPWCYIEGSWDYCFDECK